GTRSGAVRIDIAYHGATSIAQADGLGYIGRHLADLHTDASTRYLAMLFELLDDPHAFVDGDGQGDTHETPALRNDLGVDPDHFSGKVDERTTRVARVDGNIGLNERQVITGVAIDGTDNTGSDGGIQTKGRPDGQHPLPFLERLGVTDGQGLQALGIDLDQGDIGTGIGPDDFSRVLFAVRHGHENTVGTFDNVMVGKDVAISRDNEAEPTPRGTIRSSCSADGGPSRRGDGRMPGGMKSGPKNQRNIS